jgi:signal transduction histidine kinase
MKEVALKKGVEMNINISNDIVVYADINMAKTITRNLISNALKFTPNGGKISISAKNTENNSVEIAVKDTGIGMNQTLLDNLFRIDVQSNRKGTENEPSSGLGLLLCKDFVEKNGGEIWVESEENKGSVFYFTIPKKQLKI